MNLEKHGIVLEKVNKNHMEDPVTQMECMVSWRPLGELVRTQTLLQIIDKGFLRLFLLLRVCLFLSFSGRFTRATH